MRTAIVNLGAIVSGDWRTPFAEGNAILCDGEFIEGGTEDGAFRDATVSLSHPLGATGADMSLNYTWGGEDRFGTSGDGYLNNRFWAGATFSF